MWDRFAPRMRKIVTTALEQAGRVRADEASAEHLLWAVARDPACAGSFMLEHCGAAPAKVIESLSASADDNGHGSQLAQQPWTQRATRLASSAMHVLDVAAGEADRRGDRHIGSEHV